MLKMLSRTLMLLGDPIFGEQIADRVGRHGDGKKPTGATAVAAADMLDAAADQQVRRDLIGRPEVEGMARQYCRAARPISPGTFERRISPSI